MSTIHCLCLLIFWCVTGVSFSQAPPADFEINFDRNTINETHHKLSVSGSDLSRTEDRFGNANYSIYTNGHRNSYLRVKYGNKFNSSSFSISIWVKLIARMYTGKGLDYNPVLSIRCNKSNDFCHSLWIGYLPHNGHISAASTKDSTQDAGILSNRPFIFNEWHHLVVSISDSTLTFYMDGICEGTAKKDFHSVFLPDRDLIIGQSDNTKNMRFSLGNFDDIRIYNRQLSKTEVLELYNAPDPNHTMFLLKRIGLITVFVLAFALIMWLVVRRYKTIIRQKEEKLKLNRHIHQLEFKAVRSQMNPHLLSNSLAAIQDLILHGKEKESALYLARFNLFLRKVLHVSDQTFISLYEELEMVELYIGLEQLRFPESFTFMLEIDTELDTESAVVPSLILQPFIENAIWHGLIPLQHTRSPELRLQISRGVQSLTIVIHDNGVGRLAHPVKQSSKGTQLISEKLQAIRNLQDAVHCTFEIIDLSENGLPNGTKVILQITYHEDPIDTY